MTTTSTPTPAPHPISTAPRDGKMLRLWVRYPEDGSWTPLDDARESWTIGFNNLDNTEEDRWQIVGWSWSHDLLVEAGDDVEVLGWLPFHGEAAPAPEITTWAEGFIADEEDGPAVGICIDLPNGSQIWTGECSKTLLAEAAARGDSPDESGHFLIVATKDQPTRVVAQIATVDDGIRLARAWASQEPAATAATLIAPENYVQNVSTRDAAVAYRARIACDILEGFTDGIDGDRLGELARWVTHGRALDNVALHRAFAAPWIAAADEAAWKGDPDVEAVKDIERHTIAARVRGATSFTPDQLATIFARQNQLKAAATAVSAIRPSNWNDSEDQEQREAWTALDEALK